MTQNHGLIPLEKSNMPNPNFKLFTIALCSSLNFPQTSFFIVFRQKSPSGKSSIFTPKSWVNPFGKIQYGHDQHQILYNCPFRSFYTHTHSQKQQQQKQILIFDPKSWINRFGKIQYDHPQPKLSSYSIFFYSW